MKFIWNAALTIGATILAGQGLGASLEPKGDDVPILEEPNGTAKVVKTLKKGESVEHKERKGMFWEVVVPGGKVGYVSFMKVKIQESGSDNTLAKAIRDKAQSSRSGDTGSGRARAAVMGVRGLDDDEDIASAGSVRPNLRMVYSMEDRKVDRARMASLGDDIGKEVEQRARKKGVQVP